MYSPRKQKETLKLTPKKMSSVRPTGKTCMKLLSTALHQAISIKQLRDLYIHVAYTIQNYLGRPSDACLEDIPELCRYANHICPDLTTREKKSLWNKSESLPPPEVQIFVELILAELNESAKLKGAAKVYCILRTTKHNKQLTSEKAFTLKPRWRENFIFNIRDFKGGCLTVEVWMIPKDEEKPVLIGEASQDLEMVPCTGDELWLSIDEHNDPTVKRGYLTVRCCLQVETKGCRVPVIYRHLLMCRFCFEHELQASQRLFLDIPSSGSWHPSCSDKGLYQHGLARILPSAAVTFLHQHATQNGLSPWENQICCWLIAEHFYRSGYDINTGVVHALLHEVTALGSCPQRPLEPELKALHLLGVEASVSKCCFWLRGIYGHIGDGSVCERKELEHVIRYLLHMETFYVSDAVEKARDAMQQGSKNWLKKHLKCLEGYVQDWHSIAETVERSLLKVLEIQKVIDPIFSRVWEKKFTDIVSKYIDIALKESVGSVMEDMAEQLAIGKEKYTRGIVNQLIDIFIAVRNLGYYIVQQSAPARAGTPLYVESCHQWVGNEAFLMYLRQKSDETTQWLVSWIENDKDETSMAKTDDTFYTLIKQLLRAWRELIWPDPRPSTDALVQVVRKTSSFCCQHLHSYVTDQSFFCTDKHFVVTPMICSALCKLDKIEKYCAMVKDEVMNRVNADMVGELLVPLAGINFDVEETTKYICGHVVQRVQRVVDLQVKQALSSEERVSTTVLMDLQKYCDDAQNIFQKHLFKKPYDEIHSYVVTMIRGIVKGIQPMDGTKKSNRFMKVVYVLQKSFNTAEKSGGDC